MPGKQKTQYTVEALVVKGDGIPDGDLVTKYVNGKVKQRLFIPFSKMKVTLKEQQSKSKASTKDVPDRTRSKSSKCNTCDGTLRTESTGKREKVVYVKVPDNIGETDKRVVVQGSSQLGRYIKQGGFEEIGAMMVSGLLKVLMFLFL